MHLKMRFQMHLKNAFKRWEIFPKDLEVMPIFFEKVPLSQLTCNS